MPSFLSPVFGAGAQLFDNQGRVLAGGKIYTYVGGTTTLTATFVDDTDLVTNPNPIILDSAGRPPNEIWLEEGQATKFVLTDASDNVLGTWDNVAGVNDITTFTTTAEWSNINVTPSYISATSFSVPGNLVSTLMENRRLMISVTAGTIYAYITSSSFGAGITTVTVQPDSTSLDSGISQVMVGLLKASPSSVPQQYLACNAAVSVASATPTIGAATSASVTVTGTNTITAFDTVVAGIVRLAKFSGALTLTHNATSLILPGGANITTAANDQAIFRSLGSGNWECINYQRAAYGPDTIPAIPSGTRMVFNQTTAPTGWTKDTTAGLNDSLMRIVTGAVGSGGSQAFSTWNALTATGAHTLIIAEMPAHTHTGAYISGGQNTGSASPPAVGAVDTNPTGSTGGDGSHTHPLTNGLKYNDFIIATKD